MTPEMMRQYLAVHAPELEVVELPEAHTTEYISREWKVLPAQVAKTLTLRVGENAIVVVTCGDSRLDNRKVREALGGKAHMMPGSEASEITGHSVGAITPLCLGSSLPVFFDIGLKRFQEVVTAGGSTHAAIRIPLTRFAQLTGATWVDVCKETSANGERAPTTVQLHMELANTEIPPLPVPITKGRCSMSTLSLQMLRALLLAMLLAGALAGSAMAQAPGAGCALPSEPNGIPAAIDAAISGPADKDRACMKALFIPEARMTFVSLGTDGTPTYRLETLDDWIARVKARGHAVLEEKQLKFRIERYGNIAHLWSSYTLQSDGKQVARGINSIQAIKEAGGWRVTGIMVQAESATAPLPKEYLP